MCGIAGIIRKDNDFDLSQVNVMGPFLKHRGPDDSGAYVDEIIGLTHKRLSVLDLSSCGHQPMLNDSNSLVIIFNGEIYNFQELRDALYREGYVFKSNSDTEVILKGYEKWGCDIFLKLNGIFSFAIWNKVEKELLLVRDRLGVKPLYIYETNSVLYFGSEIKAIRSVCSELNQLNFEALYEFLFYGNSLGDKTLFKNIYSVKPGSFIRVKHGSVSYHSYWKPENITEKNEVGFGEASLQVRSLLETAVSRQLISDVSVGVFLSGGIDSSAITAFATKKYPRKIKTFAASFEFDKGINELEKARFVSNYFETEHVEFHIEGKGLPELFEKMIYHHDEPFSDAANIPLYLMAREVKQHATVVLQGDGGDELFGGYNRYSLIRKFGKGFERIGAQFFYLLTRKLSVSPRLKKHIRIIDAFGQKNDAEMMALLLTLDTLRNNTLQCLGRPLRESLSEFSPFSYYCDTEQRFRDKDLLQKMLYTDTQIILRNTFLEKVDKSTMAASIEARVPFLDNDLVEYVMSLPSEIKLRNKEKKGLLKKALRGIVPDQVLDGPKTGFSVPYENWLKGPLYEYLIDKTHSSYITQLQLFDYSVLDKRIKDHKNSKSDYGFQLWKLLNLCVWLEKNQISV